MDKIKVIIFSIILGIISISYSFAQKQEVEKKLTTLKIEKEVYTLGKVKLGDKVEANFKIINTGKNNLFIEEVITSCGCTGYKLSADNVAAQEEINLFVEIDTQEKRKGEHTFDILIRTNTYDRFYRLKVQVDLYSETK